MFRPIEPANISFLTSTSVVEARRLIVERLRVQGGQIASDSANEIVANFGSNLKMRLLGLALAGINTFPRQMVIKLTESNGEIEFTITVRDTAGFGSRMGYTKTLEQLMQQQASDIKACFPDARDGNKVRGSGHGRETPSPGSTGFVSTRS